MTTRKVAYYVGLPGFKGARQAALARDGHRCRYCGTNTYRGVNETVDHLFPRIRGGRDSLMNLVTACTDCNRDKGDMTLREAGMRLLPIPEHDPRLVAVWRAMATRKNCVHCGRTYKAHVRDSSYPHGHQLRCRWTDLRFLPRDCPPETFKALGIDIPSTDVVY